MAKAHALFITDGEDGVVSEIDLDGQLKTYQTLVDGYIELVEVIDVMFVVDEEGKVKGKPINWVATYYLWTLDPRWRGHDVLCGPVVMLGVSGDSTMPADVPESVLKYFELA